MVIAKLSRPSSTEKDVELVLYCSPIMLSEVFMDLNPSDCLKTKVEFIKVITND